MSWLQEQVDKLVEYLDGYNDKLDTGNGKLDEIIAGINQGLEAINGLVGAIQGLASMGSGNVSVGNIGSSSSGSGSGSNYYWYNSKDYLQDALDFAASGDWDSAMNSLWNRGNKVSLTHEDYGTNEDMAYDLVENVFNKRSYAEGIENGPVTDTGLAMLHGSE